MALEVPLVDVELVHAVAELVHRGEQGRQVAGVGVRGQPDVAEARLRRERMRRLVDPPPVGLPAERIEHEPACLLLPLDGERALERRTAVGVLGNQRKENLLEPVEDALHLRRGHSFLVLVEHHVVRTFELGEAFDVPQLQLELALEVGNERGEVRRGLRLVPGGHGDSRRVRHLRRQLARNAPRALPLPPGQPHERRVGLVVDSVEPCQEVADLVGREPLVRDARQRRDDVCAGLRSLGGHRDSGVPVRDRLRVPQVGDFPERLFEPGDAHAICGASFSRR
jgi:hypothetical protein